MDTIILSGIRALGCHGVLPEEQARPQPFEVDVELSVDLRPAGRSDVLSDTIDYDSLAGRVVQIVEAGGQPPSPERRWGPRPLDIDVLVVGDERVDEPDLVVPHPRIHQRAFVLAPLADVAPELVVAPTAGWQGIRRVALQLRLPKP